jgi:hypothetical protein
LGLICQAPAKKTRKAAGKKKGKDSDDEDEEEEKLTPAQKKEKAKVDKIAEELQGLKADELKEMLKYVSIW